MRRIVPALVVLLLLTACSTEVDGPEPRMADDPDEIATDPGFVCNEAHGDEGTWVTVTGESMSALVVDAIATEKDPDVELPVVDLVQRLDPTGEDEITDGMRVELDSPLGEDDGQVRWLDDETVMFRVTDDLELEPGVYDITVTNPDGQQATEHEAVGVLPPAELDAAIPELTCVEQGDRQITLEGEGILVGDDSAPTVHVDDQSYGVEETDECQGLHTVFGGHQLCEEAQLTVDEASLQAGTYDVILENPAPADCPSHPDEDEVTLTIADPPEVHDVEPTPICSEQLDYEAVEIDGEGFITLDDGADLPEVTVGSQTYEPESTGGCETIDEAPAMGAESCSELTIHIEADDLAGDVDEDEFVTDVDVQVENPEPVGCHSTEDATVGVTPPPSIETVDPRATCNNDGTVTFDVTGDHLLEVDGETPTIEVDGNDYDTDAVSCEEIDGEEGVRGCDELSVDVELEADEIEGAEAMVATNPEPANCTSEESQEFYAAGEPSIDSADPDGFCADEEVEAEELSLTGQFLYEPDGDELTVEVGGQTVDFELTACDSAIDDHGLELCGGIETEIPDGIDEDAEEVEVAVTGAEPLACGTGTFTLQRSEPPTVDDVIPQRVCSEGSTFTVEGSDLHEEATANLDGVEADEVDVDPSGESAEVTFDDQVTTGTATFEFVNPGDCGTTFEEEIRVTDGPLPVFVDPSVVFNQMTTRVTIYAAGLYGGTVDEVELLHPDGETTDLGAPSFDADRPGVLQADIPEDVLDDIDDDDLNDDGTSADFGIRLTDEEIECSNEADDLVTITDDLTVAVDSIDPPFGATDQATSVDIFADPDDDDGEVGFEATPRAYLNPVDDDVGTVGREIRSLQFVDETELNGVVPSGLSSGLYDLIVVNPDGSVGVLDDAFEVTEDRPPVISSVSPASWPNDQAALTVDVDGQYFRDDPTVEAFCQPPGVDSDDEDDLDQPSVDNVEYISATEVQFDVDTNDLDGGSACYIRLTNTDGTWDEYWPITISNPAENFLAAEAGAEFDTARRGPTTVAGAPTRKNSYLYVVGGDDGAEAGAYETGEFSRIDRFGEPVGFDYLRYDLPSGRTLGEGVVLEDFVYFVGGSDEGDATDEILRARVLDPLDVPEITTIDLDVEDFVDDTNGDSPQGLDAGTYYYEVSAVYTDDDPANPGGESLASEPQPIQLPIDDVEVTISWDPPTDLGHDIDYYRVYRNDEPDDPYGDESLIATVDGSSTSYTDDGTDDVDDDIQPLPLGSLGQWDHVATLNHERKSAGTTLAPHPDDDDEYLVYTVGGEGDDDEARDDYEIVEIVVDGPREQTVFDAYVGDQDLPAAQSRHAAEAAYGSNASVLSDESPQIFSVGGGDGGDANAVHVASVQSDGQLGEWESTNGIDGFSRSGHAAAAHNGDISVIGGNSGDPSDNTQHADITCGDECPPAGLGGWTNVGDIGAAQRVTMGDLTFQGFWYLTGGEGPGGPTNTVDYTAAGATP